MFCQLPVHVAKGLPQDKQRQALQRGLRSRTSFGCGSALRARDPTFRPQNWEAPGRAHSVHPARAPSGRSSFALSGMIGVMPPQRSGWVGKRTASRRGLRRHARLASVATCIHALRDRRYSADCGAERLLDAEVRFERVIRHSAPKTGRHRAGRTPPSTPCRLS